MGFDKHQKLNSVRKVLGIALAKQKAAFARKKAAATKDEIAAAKNEIAAAKEAFKNTLGKLGLTPEETELLRIFTDGKKTQLAYGVVFLMNIKDKIETGKLDQWRPADLAKAWFLNCKAEGDLDTWALQNKFDVWVGCGMDDAAVVKAWSPHWSSNISEAMTWIRAGWGRDGISADEAWAWFAVGYKPAEALFGRYKVTLDDAEKYRTFAGGNRQRAMDLYRAGYSLSELDYCEKNHIGGLLDGDTNYVGLEPAIVWKRSGFTFEKDIVDWMKKFSAADAYNWKIEKGLSLIDALKTAEEEKKFKAAAGRAKAAKKSKENEAKTDSEKNSKISNQTKAKSKNETISPDESQDNKAYDICTKRKMSADKAEKLGFLNYSDIPQGLKEWENIGLDFIVKYYCDKYNIDKNIAIKLFKGKDNYSAETIRNEVKKYNLTHSGIVSNSETKMGFTFKTKDGVKIASFEPDKNAIDSKQYFVQPSILKEVLEKFKVRDAIKLKILPEIEFVVIKFSKNMEKIEFDRSLTTLWLRNYKKLLKDNKSSLKLIVIFQGDVFVGATKCKMFSDSTSIPSKRSDGNIKGRPIIHVNSFQVISKLLRN